MKDVITYCADLDALRKELTSLNRTTEAVEGETPTPVLNVMKTPVMEKDGHSLSLVRIMNAEDEEALHLNSIEVLGTYDEVFADPEKMAKYESVYSTQPYEVADEDGKKHNVEPPKKFGVFYG